MQTPSAYKWTGPSGQVEFDTESECSAVAAAVGWTKEPLYTEAQMAAAVAAERERWIAACEAERAEFAERAANNDGSRQSDFAFGSVNSAERIKAAGLGLNV